MINYQGRITDTSGKSITGTYTMTFRLYDASSGGSKQWEEQQTVAIAEADNGTFNVILGSVTSLSSVDFNTPMWLSVQITGDSEMSPRQRLTSMGYALNADKVDSLDSSSFLRSDVDTSTSGKVTITRSGTVFVIKPTTDPAADTKLIDVQNAAGTSKFSVDLDIQNAAGTSKFSVNLAGCGKTPGDTTEGTESHRNTETFSSSTLLWLCGASVVLWCHPELFSTLLKRTAYAAKAKTPEERPWRGETCRALLSVMDPAQNSEACQPVTPSVIHPAGVRGRG